MAVTTSTLIPAPIRTFYDRILLERALSLNLHQKFGQQRPVSLNSGDQPKFVKYNSLTVATAPLVEGVTPTAQALSQTTVTGQLKQYGGFVELSDYISMTSQDKLVAETTSIIGENAGESLEIVVRDILAAGTSYRRANGVTNRTDIVAKLNATDLDKIIRALHVNKAKPFTTKPIIGSDKVGTTPIAPSYYAIIDAYTLYDLQSILTTSFIEPHKYPDGGKSAMEGEVGSYKEIRFVLSANAKVWADAGGTATAATLKYTTATTACDVHSMLIFGQNAYGITPLSGKSMETIIKAPQDPLNQKSTVGWKSCMSALILDDTLMYRYEFGVSR